MRRFSSRIGDGLEQERAMAIRTWTSLRAALACALLVSTQPAAGQGNAPQDGRAEVFAAERAFARTMADRDHAAFGRHLADDAVFFGGKSVAHGRAAVLAAWKAFFDGPQAPFSWEPDQVEVLASGQLALSTGPVRNPQGQVIARFNSIWRREADGRWLVVFDKGSPPDPPAK
jgi:ketosteroid isomerase-like protein